jgi:hypothetical protein
MFHANLIDEEQWIVPGIPPLISSPLNGLGFKRVRG